jgi:hypothetical protein
VGWVGRVAGTHIGRLPNSATGCCQACGDDSPRWQAFTFAQGKGCWCHPAGEYKLESKQGYISGTCRELSPPTPVGPLVYDDAKDLETAVSIARQAEVAIVVLAQTSHEGADRTTLALDQSDLVTSIAAAQPNTIVLT